MYNNHIIANCPQSALVKEFRKSVNIGKDMDKSKVPRFCWPTLYKLSCNLHTFDMIRKLYFSLCIVAVNDCCSVQKCISTFLLKFGYHRLHADPGKSGI